MQQPNFFIVGAPKAGTTSLYHHLDQHPQVYMSPIKEPCYFASEIRPETFGDDLKGQVARDAEALNDYLAGPMLEKRHGGIVTDWRQYMRLFANVTLETAVGEASVCYLWSPTAAANIYARLPNARIIMILRNPVDRAFSQYLHGVSGGWIRRSFREHIDGNLRNREQKFGLDFPFLELGLYYEQVKRYLERFPAENVRIELYRKSSPHFSGILRFLGIDEHFVADTSHRHLALPIPRSAAVHHHLRAAGIWQRARRLCPEALLPLARRLVHRSRGKVQMDPRDRAFLAAYYREDIQKLAGLLNRDLGSWLV